MRIPLKIVYPQPTNARSFPPSLTLLAYGAPGGMRRDPGHVVESLT